MARKSKERSLGTLLLVLLFAGSCSRGVQSTVMDSQTHWLLQCSTDAECGSDLSCVCGVCTKECNGAGACFVAGKNVDCVEADEDSARLLCGNEPRALCLELCGGDAECGGNEQCFEGHCIPDSRVGGDAGPSDSGTPCTSTGTDECEDTDECTWRSQSACNLECSPIYGTAIDGRRIYAGCTADANSDDALTCATNGVGGQPLLFQTTSIPNGWLLEANLEACQVECYSPWRNAGLAEDGDLPGCPCEPPSGGACIDRVAIICNYPSQNPSWSFVFDGPCNGRQNVDALPRDLSVQECIEHYYECHPSGDVLDDGTVLFAGEGDLECEGRSESACGCILQPNGECVEHCSSLYGTLPSGHTSYVGCVNVTECSDSERKDRCVRSTSATGSGVSAVTLQLDNACGISEVWDEVSAAECSDVAYCAAQNESDCTGDCIPVMGRRAMSQVMEYFGCRYLPCETNSSICAEDGAGGPAVEFAGCVPPGFQETNPEECAL